MLPKITAYTGDFDETKYMSFSIKNEELLVNIQENIGIKSAISLKKDLIVNLFMMKKNLGTKKKYYEGKMSRNFHRDEIPKNVLNAFVYQ